MNGINAGYAVVIGLLLAFIGSFGHHLLTNFNGRSLESYCLLKRRRERFGQILDLQDSGSTACTYLFLFGVTVVLVFGTSFVLAFLPSEELQRKYAPDMPIATVSLYATVAFIAATTMLLMLLRVWLPKLVLQDRASRLLYYTWPLWKLISFAGIPFQPIEAFFTWIGHRLGDEVQDDAFDEESLEDEIRTMVTAGEREGLMRKGMREMIQGVMNLDEYPVLNVMTHRSEIDALDIHLSPQELIDAAVASGHTRLPVYDGSLDNVVGILFVKDLLEYLKIERSEIVFDTRSLLREAWKVPGSRPVYELLRDFLHRKSHMAIVVDDFSETIGVVTIEDVLEEIVGEIADELDEDERSEIVQHENSATVDAVGRVTVERFNQIVGWDLPESDDYETLAGMVITRLGAIPKQETSLQVGPIQIQVLQATDRQLQLLRLQHLDAEVSPSDAYAPVRSIAEV